MRRQLFNPWIGCEKVSAGCKHCYAETLVTGRMGRPGSWGPQGVRHRTAVSTWKHPVRWNRLAAEGKLPDGGPLPAGRRTRVFCASLADVFEPRPELDPWRRDLFDLIAATPNLDWLVLTKRPDEAAAWLRAWYAEMQGAVSLGGTLPFEEGENGVYWNHRDDLGWGVLPNLWIGTSIENSRFTWRADELRKIPAAVRFISAEPLLGSLFAPPHAGGGATSGSPASPGESARRGVRAGSTPAGATGGSTPGEVTGENRTRPDAAGGTGGVQSAGAGGPGSIPGLSTPHENATASDQAEGAGPAEESPAARALPNRHALVSRQGGPGEPRLRAPLDLTGIDWVIVGGESGGPDTRPMHPEWAREIRGAVMGIRLSNHTHMPAGAPAGPAFHFKQWGSWSPADPKDGGQWDFGDKKARAWVTPAGRMIPNGAPHVADGSAWMRYCGSAPTAGGSDLDGVAWREFPVGA